MTNKEHIDWLVSVCKLGGTITTTKPIQSVFGGIVPAGTPFVLTVQNSKLIQLFRRPKQYQGGDVFTVRRFEMRTFTIYEKPNDLPHNAR